MMIQHVVVVVVVSKTTASYSWMVLLLLVVVAAVNFVEMVDSFNIIILPSSVSSSFSSSSSSFYSQQKRRRLLFLSSKHNNEDDDDEGHDNDDKEQSSLSSQSSQLLYPSSRTPTIYRLYTGDDLQSHIEEISLDNMNPFLDKEGAYGLATPLVTNIEGIIFRTSPIGYELKWHTAPRKQYMIMLRGCVEIEVGNSNNGNNGSNKIQLGPGDVVLVEDLTGQGHITRVVGNEQRFYAIIPITEE